MRYILKFLVCVAGMIGISFTGSVHGQNIQVERGIFCKTAEYLERILVAPLPLQEMEGLNAESGQSVCTELTIAFEIIEEYPMKASATGIRFAISKIVIYAYEIMPGVLTSVSPNEAYACFKFIPPLPEDQGIQT